MSVTRPFGMPYGSNQAEGGSSMIGLDNSDMTLYSKKTRIAYRSGTDCLAAARKSMANLIGADRLLAM